jgi:hypothetical protein
MSEFGIFAKDLICKVTIEPTHRERAISIPCSIGFKQKDGKWVNEFVDVLLFEKTFDLDDGIHKGEKIKVSGRMNLSEYNGKKKWSIYADKIETDRGTSDPQQAPLEDVPF